MNRAELDIPKSTVFVLLIITIIISILGTWTILDTIKIEQKAPATQEARVQLTIIPSPEANKNPNPSTTALVELNIIK